MITEQFAADSFSITDKAGFEKLFRAKYSLLCSYSNQFLNDIDLSEEVVQEVMFRLWMNRQRIVISTSIESYLFRSVRNACLNLIRHEGVKSEFRDWKEHQGDDLLPSGEDVMIRSELENRIRQAIDELPQARKKIFILSRYDGLTYLQIAEKLGISVKTVENQMGKALKTLRDELKDYLPWITLFLLNFWDN